MFKRRGDWELHYKIPRHNKCSNGEETGNYTRTYGDTINAPNGEETGHYTRTFIDINNCSQQKLRQACKGILTLTDSTAYNWCRLRLIRPNLYRDGICSQKGWPVAEDLQRHIILLFIIVLRD